ncbi:Uncharacterised protein [uncultured archaeon]|nr:Uncharacterised protein [uncultured archaeon]
MEKEKRAIYSHSRFDLSDFRGIFENTRDYVPSPEESLLEEVVKGSKYKPDNIVAIAFANVNGNKIAEINDFYLTSKGSRESIDARFNSDYQTLFRKLNTRIINILEDSLKIHDPLLSEIAKDRNSSGQNKKLLPYYISLDENRVLAVYINK